MGEQPYPIVSTLDEQCSHNEDKNGNITEISFEYESEAPLVASIDNKIENLSDVAKLQRQCSELSDLVKYLETGNLPKDDKKAFNCLSVLTNSFPSNRLC